MVEFVEFSHFPLLVKYPKYEPNATNTANIGKAIKIQISPSIAKINRPIKAIAKVKKLNPKLSILLIPFFLPAIYGGR